jgi:retron-type reverse transcriptase
MHRITDKISSSLEKKEQCPYVFFEIAQAFDRVCHDGLLFKFKSFLPAPYFLILKSYLEDRYFTVKHNNSYSPYHKIKAGVPQGSDLSPIFYNIYIYIYTSDIPKTNHTILATYADDTAILASNKNPNIATHDIQFTLNQISNWTKKWKVKINEKKISSNKCFS